MLKLTHAGKDKLHASASMKGRMQPTSQSYTLAPVMPTGPEDVTSKSVGKKNSAQGTRGSHTLPCRATSLRTIALLPTLLCRCSPILQHQLPSSAVKSCNPLWRTTSRAQLRRILALSRALPQLSQRCCCTAAAVTPRATEEGINDKQMIHAKTMPCTSQWPIQTAIASIGITFQHHAMDVRPEMQPAALPAQTNVQRDIPIIQ